MKTGQHIERIEKMIRNNEAVVLNSGLETLDIAPWQDAMTIVLSEDAYILAGKTDGTLVRSQHLTLPRPLIVARHRYHVPHRPGEAAEAKATLVSGDATVSKSTVLARDNWECVYCGFGSRNKMTVDHIIPQSKGGQDTWNNLVASCRPCNSFKADKSLEEVGYNEPVIPEMSGDNQARFATIDRAVQRYLREEYAQESSDVDLNKYMSV